MAPWQLCRPAGFLAKPCRGERTTFLGYVPEAAALFEALTLHSPSYDLTSRNLSKHRLLFSVPRKGCCRIPLHCA